MKIYLAATWSARERMIKTSKVLQALGYTTTSRWLDDAHINGTESECAQIDLDDIDISDALMLFSVGPRGTSFTGGGRCVEFGYALAKGKLLILIGEQETVFHALSQVMRFDTFQAFLDSDLCQ